VDVKQCVERLCDLVAGGRGFVVVVEVLARDAAEVVDLRRVCFGHRGAIHEQVATLSPKQESAYFERRPEPKRLGLRCVEIRDHDIHESFSSFTCFLGCPRMVMSGAFDVSLSSPYGAAVPLERSCVYAPGDDALRMDADHLFRLRNRFRSAPDLQSPWPPRVRGGEVIHHEGGMSLPRDIAELLGARQVASSDVYGVEIGVEGEHADRRDVRRAVAADRRHASEETAAEVLDLISGEVAHQ